MTRRHFECATLAALAATLLCAQVALADDVTARVEVTARPSTKADQGYVLDAHLVTTDGKPVNDVAVRFYEIVDLLGSREMLVGVATTDGQGRTSLSYLPARTGPHAIVVRFAGRDRVPPAEGRTAFLATAAAAPYLPERSPLSAFSDAVPYAVAAVVLAVWSLIGFALIGTARGVIGGARTARKGDTA